MHGAIEAGHCLASPLGVPFTVKHGEDRMDENRDEADYLDQDDPSDIVALGSITGEPVDCPNREYDDHDAHDYRYAEDILAQL